MVARPSNRQCASWGALSQSDGRAAALLLGIDVGTSLCKAGLVTPDGRTVGLAQAMSRAVFARHAGLPALRVTTLVKLRWLFAHGLSRQRACRWLNTAEWIAFCLGAEPVAELSLASRTGLFDQQTQDWWPDA